MFSSLVYVSISTMGKIVLGVLAGVFVSPHLFAPIESEKGLSFITLRVLLSAMLFSNVCFDVSLTLLSKYYWAVIMSLVPMVLGGLMSIACTRLVSREYRCLVVLGSTFQNGLVFPLTVVTSIKGVAWLDDVAVRHCQQFVFLYNLTCALGLWSIGSPMVKHYKDKFANEKIEAEAEADYLASLLVYYKRIMRREGPHKVVGADSSSSTAPKGSFAAVASTSQFPGEESERVATATQDAVEHLQDLVSQTHRTPHASLKGMTVIDVLGEFMYRIRAARGGVEHSRASHTQTRSAAVHVPSSSTTASRRVEGGEEEEEENGDDDGARHGGTGTSASQIKDGHTRREAGVAEAVMRAALTATPTMESPGSPTTPTVTWLTPESAPPSTVPTSRVAGASAGGASGSVSHLPRTTVATRTRSAHEEEEELPVTDAGRQLVLYRPLSSGSKMRPINMRKFDVWESRQHRQREETDGEREADHSKGKGAAVDRTDVGADASPLFLPPEDLYLDPNRPAPSRPRPNKKGQSGSKSEPFTYAYVSTIGNIVHGCCGGGSSSSDDDVGEVDGAGLPRNMQLRERDRPCSYRFRKFLRLANGAFQTMPVWATLLAICISLIPPLRWLAETVPCAMVIQGLHIVGDGCVPVQLVVLGCTLATKRLMDPLVLQRTDEQMRVREMDAPETLVQRLTLAKLRSRLLGKGSSRTRRHTRQADIVKTVKPSAAASASASAGPEKGSYVAGQPVDAQLILGSHPTVDAAAIPGKAGADHPNWADDGMLDLLATEGLSASSSSSRLGFSTTSGKRWTWWERVPSATRLAVIIMALRLLIVPAISFLIVHVLMKYKIMPTDRPFVVSILIGISSPAAVNSSLACTMHGYHADEYSRVMFVMHVAAIVTSTFWLVVSITYTEKMGTDLYR